MTVEVRAYGGWYVGNSAPRERYEAAEFYGAQIPAAFVHHGRLVRVRFEFADSLALDGRRPYHEGPAADITHTVATRSRFTRVRLKDANALPPCASPNCELANTRKWIRKARACPANACPLAFSDCFEREEQKQVDVHMSVDLLTYAATPIHVAVASDDADILPALAAASLSKHPLTTLTALRFQVQTTYLDGFLKHHAVVIRTITRDSD